MTHGNYLLEVYFLDNPNVQCCKHYWAVRWLFHYQYLWMVKPVIWSQVLDDWILSDGDSTRRQCQLHLQTP